MMPEAPHMPTTEEIEERAVEMFMMEHPEAPTPEPEELKESTVMTGTWAGFTYWDAAQRDLMSGFRASLESYLDFLESEARETRKALGRKAEVTPAEYEELKREALETRRKYRETRKRLEDARKRIAELKRAKPPRPRIPPPKPREVPRKPPKVPPLPVERGLTKADEKRLLARFNALLLERTITPRKWKPMFDDRLYEWREAFKELPREEALTRSLSEVDRLVGRIMELAKPPKPPAVPPEVPRVPEVVPPLVAPPPFVGAFRRWGMPWTLEPCPVCLGEVELGERRAEAVNMVERSRYLEVRLRQIGVPTSSAAFFELCDEHRRRYGATYESGPRNKIEFWVGAVLDAGLYDTAHFTALGIPYEYIKHCELFYSEHKHETIPPFKKKEGF